jgi:hypothetical protein
MKELATDTEETPEQFEAGCRASASQDMEKEEIRWKDRGLCFSWIDKEPTWVPVSQWEVICCPDFEVDKACDRIMRFALLGGGQIRTTERFRFFRFSNLNPPQTMLLLDKTELKITAHTQDGVVIVSGEKDHAGCEMSAEAVLVRGNRQDIADIAAATFRLMGNERENFYALLDGSAGCAICGRTLRDEISKLVSVGPDCARQYGVPHSREAAEKRLILRRKLLGEGQ